MSLPAGLPNGGLAGAGGSGISGLGGVSGRCTQPPCSPACFNFLHNGEPKFLSLLFHGARCTLCAQEHVSQPLSND